MELPLSPTRATNWLCFSDAENDSHSVNDGEKQCEKERPTNGAVSGSWPNGTYHRCPGSDAVVDLPDDTSPESRRLTDRWKAVSVPQESRSPCGRLSHLIQAMARLETHMFRGDAVARDTVLTLDQTQWKTADRRQPALPRCQVGIQNVKFLCVGVLIDVSHLFRIGS